MWEHLIYLLIGWVAGVVTSILTIALLTADVIGRIRQGSR